MRKIFSTTLILSFALFVLFACQEEGGNSTNISSSTSNKSHNMGQNCMKCHKSGGEGKGWFQAAGTVYHSNGTTTNPNAIVRLYTEPNGGGELVATIEVDKKGNFYTTEDIDFSAGLYPQLEGMNNTKYMSVPTITGACNSCHGVTEAKLTVE